MVVDALAFIAVLVARLFARSLARRLSILPRETAFGMALFGANVVFLSLLLSLGPSIQSYSLMALSSSEASLYGTAYANGLSWFPQYASWLFSALNWWIVVAAAVVIWITQMAKNARECLLYGTLSCAAVLVVLDIVIGIRYGLINSAYVFENIMSDLVGGLCVSSLLLLVFRLQDLVLLFGAGIKPARVMATLSIPISLGVVTTVIAYNILRVVYNPTEPQIELAAEPPMQGYYVPRANDNKTSASQFGIFTGRATTDKIFTMTYVLSALETRWTTSNQPAIVSMMFYANCRPDEVKRLFRTAIFKARFENIHRLDVSFNKGIGSYLINLPRESAEIFVDSKDTLSGFSFQKEANSEKYSGERNLMKAASIHYSSSHERLGYAIDGVLLDAGATGKIAASSRTLTIRLNDQSYKKRIGSQTTTTGVNSSFPCRVVDVPNFEDGHVTDFKLRGLQFGVAIKIQKPPEQSYTDKEQDAVVAQAAGKIEVGGLTSDEWQRLGTQGAADGLILFRGVRRLSIQDVQMETQETDRIFLTAGGERGIIGGFTDSGRLEFEGPAHALFKNQFRLIPTRWEQFDLSVRVLFLTIIASAVSGIATALVLTLRRNDSLYWPSV